jgi:chromosome segregation ATPase
MEQLGISTLDMQQLSTEEQFLKIADALNKVDDPAKRAALAVQFFGRTGLKLLPMIEQGSAAIREQAAEMERLQGPFTDLDFTNIEEGNDAANRFGKTVEGVWNQLAAAIAPAKTLVFDTLTEAGSSLANFIGENKESITSFFMGIGEMISGAVKAISRLVKTFFNIGKALNDARNSVADFTENLLGVRLGITDMLIPLKGAWEILKKITGNSESDKLSEQIDKWNQKIADQQKAIDDLDRGLSRIRSAEITDEETPAAVLSYDELLQKADQLKEKNASAIQQAEDLTATLQQQIALGDEAVMTAEEQEKLQQRINELEQQANQSKTDYLETSKKINKEEKDMEKRAARLVDGLKTQAEKYQEQLAEIQELKERGKLSADQARRLRLQVEAKIQSDVDKVVQQQAKVAESAAKERESAMKSWADAAKNAAKDATSNLVRAGSKEMFEQVAERQFKKENPLAKFQKKSTKIATDQLDQLKTVNDNLSRLNNVVSNNTGGSGDGGNGALGGITEVGLGA